MNKKILNNILKISTLMIILLLIAGYYYYRIIPENKKKENWDKIIMMENLQKNDINKLEISYNDGTNLNVTLLEYISNEWMETFPLMEKADDESVLKIINDLSGLKSYSLITNLSEDKMKELGFDRPVDSIKIYFNNSQIIELINGSKTSSGNMYYTILNQNIDKIYLVPCGKFLNMEKKPNELRSRDIFNIPLQSLKSIELQSEYGGTLKFKFETNSGGQKFIMNFPIKTESDNFSVKSKIMDIYSLNISRFLDIVTDESVLTFYGLKNPLFYARFISMESITNELMVGKKETNGFYYAYSPQKLGIFTIDGDDLTNKFKFKADDFFTNGRK